MNGFPVFILVGFPFFFAAVWLFVMRLLSVASGWTRLAERYPYPEPFRGTLHRYQSARLRGVNFNGVLGIGVGGEGLYLAPMILFRAFHKPLLIPWGDVETEELKGLLSSGRRLSFRSVPGVHLDLSERTFEKLTDYLRA